VVEIDGESRVLQVGWDSLDILLAVGN